MAYIDVCSEKLVFTYGMPEWFSDLTSQRWRMVYTCRSPEICIYPTDYDLQHVQTEFSETVYTYTCQPCIHCWLWSTVDWCSLLEAGDPHPLSKNVGSQCSKVEFQSIWNFERTVYISMCSEMLVHTWKCQHDLTVELFSDGEWSTCRTGEICVCLTDHDLQQIPYIPHVEESLVHTCQTHQMKCYCTSNRPNKILLHSEHLPCLLMVYKSLVCTCQTCQIKCYCTLSIYPIHQQFAHVKQAKWNAIALWAYTLFTNGSEIVSSHISNMSNKMLLNSENIPYPTMVQKSSVRTYQTHQNVIALQKYTLYTNGSEIVGSHTSKRPNKILLHSGHILYLSMVHRLSVRTCQTCQIKCYCTLSIYLIHQWLRNCQFAHIKHTK